MSVTSKIPIFDKYEAAPPENCDEDAIEGDKGCPWVTPYQRIQSGEDVNMASEGLMSTQVPAKDINFVKCPNQKVINRNGSDSWIVMGYDSPAGCASGYSAIGATNSNAIDIVVGRMAAVRKGKGPKSGWLVNPSFEADAARVYISQLTEIDKHMGLAAGVSGNQEGAPRSAVAVKADDVRLVARNSLKIVTGRMKGKDGAAEKLSTGGENPQRAPTIELIAGNYTEVNKSWGGIYNTPDRIPYLQRAVKGDNLCRAMYDLNTIVGQIWSAVFNLTVSQVGWNAVAGIDPLRPWVAAKSVETGIAQLDFVLNSLWHTRIKSTLWKKNFLDDEGKRFICSRNVKLT